MTRIQIVQHRLDVLRKLRAERVSSDDPFTDSVLKTAEQHGIGFHDVEKLIRLAYAQGAKDALGRQKHAPDVAALPEISPTAIPGDRRLKQSV